METGSAAFDPQQRPQRGIHASNEKQNTFSLHAPFTVAFLMDAKSESRQYQNSSSHRRDGVPSLPPVHAALTVSTSDPVQKP